MHKKRFHLFKAFTKKLQRVFRARNIIIVSDHKLDHVPISGTMQVLILVGVLGFFSGVSYLTGSYMNARVVIREKERTLAKTRIERAHISEEMAQLKRDLTGYNANKKEIAEGTSELSKKLSFDVGSATVGGQQKGQLNPLFAAPEDNEKLSLRVAYLESRMKKNEQLLSAIRTRTSKNIELFEDIIAMTGLDEDRLEHDASAKMSSETSQNASAGRSSGNTPKPAAGNTKENQGGPFIPDNGQASVEDTELLASVDRLVLLSNIIQQLPLSQPIHNAQMTGGFGRRVDPINGRLAIHPGLDLAGPMNAPISATSAGKVIYAGRKAAYGNVVEVEHGFGIVTRYAHLSKVIAKEGTKVRKGQVIGLQGSTGRSTGSHLHYEVRIDDHPVNPLKFLQAGEYVLEK